MKRIAAAALVGGAIVLGATGCNSGHSHHTHTIVPAPAQTHIHIHQQAPTTGKRNVVRTPSRKSTSGITRGRVSTTKRGR